VLNISSDGSLTCITNYTDNSGGGSIDGVEHFYYENTTGLVYLTGYIDDYLTILNLTNPMSITVADSISLSVFDTIAVAVATVGSDKFAFVSSTTTNQGIKVVNVTNPLNILYYGLFNETSGSCILNTIHDMYTYGDYLYVGSDTDDCFYVIKLTAESDAPIFAKFNGITTNFNKYTSSYFTNLSGVTLEVSSYGYIEWNQGVNVSNADFNTHVDIGSGYIYVNSSALHPSLNSSANITFYNTGGANLILLKNGAPCTTCTFISFSGGNLTYQVTGFSNYSLTMNITLISPSNGNSSINSPVYFVSNITDFTTIVNATLYTNESGTFAARETRWNGEVPWNDTDLRVLYHFNNESVFGENGTKIFDWSRTGINLSCPDTCPIYNASGRFGSAQYKQPSDNDFFAPDSDYFTNWTALTIVAWINPLRNQSEQGGEGGDIVSKRNDGNIDPNGNYDAF
jgi:hypothetical protein